MGLMSNLFTRVFLWLSLAVQHAYFDISGVSVCPNGITYSPQYFSALSICKREEYTLKLFKSMTEWEQLYISQDQILLQHFPIDPDEDNYVRRVKNVIFSAVNPTPLKTKLRLVAVSKSALKLLDMSTEIINNEEFVKFASGNNVPQSTIPLSHRYGGHQFGSWAGQLGDGRAVMLGEFTNSHGKRWELQLKGSGKTPYSRQGDGRAVLRSSVREFLCSEALHYLGIPSSRAATLVVSDDPVIRDQFYTGNVITERAAVVLRLAKSWFRFGSLEILSYNNEIRLLRKLVDFIIEQHFSDISQQDTNKYLDLYSRVVKETAELVAKWQSVGFTHGVCNTDNFSILSVTIDFGPFGFLDHYDSRFIPNTSDDEGRYSYEKQPDVGYYNLDKLRLALLPLLGNKQKKIAIDMLKGYAGHYRIHFMHLYSYKLGVPLSVNRENDENLVAVLLKIMEETKADYTMTFRQLGEISISDLLNNNIPKSWWALTILNKHKWFESWVQIYAQILQLNLISDDQRRTEMLKHNPRYILRNWIAQTAIGRAENNDFSYVRKVLEILSNPYVEQKEAEDLGFARRPPSWASSLKVSCSS